MLEDVADASYDEIDDREPNKWVALDVNVDFVAWADGLREAMSLEEYM